MKERAGDARALDLLALCRQAGSLQGQWPLSGMVRLGASFCAASDGSASWRASGSLKPVTGGEPEIWLVLEADADVPLECQRCLRPMNEHLRVQRRLRFVRGEEQAALLDEQADDDVLALPPRLDLHELLEDELILALPIVPRHRNCPDPLPLPAEEALEEEPAPRPFAALAALRGRASGDGGEGPHG